MNINNQDRIIENLKKCPHFDNCSQNFCPLDLALSERTGGKQDNCRWMREAKQVKIAGREFVSGGGVMLDAPLNFVPNVNLGRLNQASRIRWQKLKRN
jgi:hypothetical protein